MFTRSTRARRCPVLSRLHFLAHSEFKPNTRGKEPSSSLAGALSFLNIISDRVNQKYSQVNNTNMTFTSLPTALSLAIKEEEKAGFPVEGEQASENSSTSEEGQAVMRSGGGINRSHHLPFIHPAAAPLPAASFLNTFLKDEDPTAYGATSTSAGAREAPPRAVVPTPPDCSDLGRLSPCSPTTTILLPEEASLQNERSSSPRGTNLESRLRSVSFAKEDTHIRRDSHIQVEDDFEKEGILAHDTNQNSSSTLLETSVSSSNQSQEDDCPTIAAANTPTITPTATTSTTPPQIIVASATTTTTHSKMFFLSNDLLTLGSVTSRKVNLRHQIHELICRSTTDELENVQLSLFNDPIEQKLVRTLQQSLVLVEQNENERAVVMFSRVRALLEESEPSLPEHSLGSLNYKAGLVCMVTENFSVARAFFQEAVDIFLETLGTEHPATTKSMSLLAMAQLVLKDRETAFRTMSDIRDCYLSSQGFGHPHMATLNNNFGVVHFAEGSVDRARRAFEIALKYQENLLKTKDVIDKAAVEVSMSHTLCNLAHCHLSENRTSDAISLFQNALNLQMRNGSIEDAMHTRENLDCLVNQAAGGLPCQSFNPEWMMSIFSCGDVQ